MPAALLDAAARADPGRLSRALAMQRAWVLAHRGERAVVPAEAGGSLTSSQTHAEVVSTLRRLRAPLATEVAVLRSGVDRDALVVDIVSLYHSGSQLD